MDWKRIIFITLIVWPFSLFGANNKIFQIRSSQTQQFFRIVFEAQHPIQYHRFSVEDLNQFIINIPHTQMTASLNSKKLTQTPIRQFHYSKASNGDLRIVFLMRHSTRVVTSTLAHTKKRGYRLVVDFYNSTNHNETKQAKITRVKLQPLHYQFAAPASQTQFNTHAKPTFSSDNYSPDNRDSSIIVVIDPGHGGKDPGATGIHGTQEKKVVLAISKDLQNIINEQPGFKAELTRRGDYYLTLRERLAIARRDNADLFIAIHADIYQDHSARGATVYALSQRGATSEATRWLAARENQSELMGGVSLDDKGEMLKSVLINLSQTATIRSSLEVGDDLIASLPVLLHHHVEQAAFVVLKSPDIPSLLVETGFLSNPYEEALLNDEHYRHRLAVALCHGIVQYFQNQPPPGTWLARRKFGNKLG